MPFCASASCCPECQGYQWPPYPGDPIVTGPLCCPTCLDTCEPRLQAEQACDHCGTEGVLVYLRGYSHHDGSPIEHAETCPSCGGAGGVMLPIELIDEIDLDIINEEITDYERTRPQI